MAKKRSRVAAGARRLGAFAVQGIKGTAVATGTGGAGFYLHKMANQKIEILQKHPLGAPLGMIAIGHFVKRKWPSIGAGLCGAGGYAAAMSFDATRQQKILAAANPPPDAKGLTPPSDIGALTEPSDIGAYSPPDVETMGVEDFGYGDALTLGM